MAQSLFISYQHLIFSVKHRQPLLNPAWGDNLNRYLGYKFQDIDCVPVQVNGHWNHVHCLFQMSKNHGLSAICREIKRNSAIWVKTEIGVPNFSWQRGYACFSVSPKSLDAVSEYIANQKEHHRKQTFEEEVNVFMNKFGVTGFDPQYFFE